MGESYGCTLYEGDVNLDDHFIGYDFFCVFAHLGFICFFIYFLSMSLCIFFYPVREICWCSLSGGYEFRWSFHKVWHFLRFCSVGFYYLSLDWCFLRMSLCIYFYPGEGNLLMYVIWGGYEFRLICHETWQFLCLILACWFYYLSFN